MNILYHHRTQGKGVEGVHIRGMVEAFRCLGHEVTLVSPPKIDPFLDIEKEADIQKLRLARTWRWLAKNSPEAIFEIFELSYNAWAYYKMKSIVKRKKIDFIYERYALNMFAGLSISKKYNIPLVLEVNDATGIERVRKLKVGSIAKSIEKKVFGGARAIFTISSYFKKIITASGIDGAKVFVTPNAVDESAFDVKREGGRDIRDIFRLNGNIVIGYVGAFVYWHKVDMLLNSFANLLGKNKNARLLLVGDGVTFDESKAFVKENNLENFVAFPGRVPHKEIPAYVEAMDICVIPDSNDYGSPVKLFEYMALGKAVVAPKLAPIEDVVSEDENGLLFKRGDTGEFEKALNVLLNDSDMRKRIGRSAKEKIFRDHTWTSNARKVIEVVRDN